MKYHLLITRRTRRHSPYPRMSLSLPVTCLGRDKKRRATDAYWSRKTYRLDHITEPNSQALYYLCKDIFERSFVGEDLTQIPEDVKLYPENVGKSPIFTP